MAVDVERLIQELVVPELHEIRSRVSTMEVEIRQLDEKVDGWSKRLEEKIDSIGHRLDEKVNSLKDDVHNLREEFHLAIDIHERLAALEAKIGR